MRYGRRNGKQRYRCGACGHMFVRHKHSHTLTDFKAFSSSILGDKSRRQVGKELSRSRETCAKRFHLFFLHPPTPQDIWELFPPVFSSLWVLSMDGKWLRRYGVILIYRNATDGEVLWWSWASSESYHALGADMAQIEQYCQNTLPSGVVSDWKGSMVGTVSLFFGDVPHQRCLAHVVRDIERLLPKYSPIQGTQELRKIGKDVIFISTQAHKDTWIAWLSCWYVFYGDLLTEKSYRENPMTGKIRWWYTHTNIRAAYRILTKDQDHLFIHLNTPHIPKTNNGLEGLNSNLKGKLTDHRGMKHLQQVSFVFWYLTLQKVKTKAHMKILWDYVRRWIY